MSPGRFTTGMEAGLGARPEPHRAGAAGTRSHPEHSRHHRAAARRPARGHRAGRPALRRHPARGGPADRSSAAPTAATRWGAAAAAAADVHRRRGDGLVMAVLEGHRNAADPPMVGGALARSSGCCPAGRRPGQGGALCHRSAARWRDPGQPRADDRAAQSCAPGAGCAGHRMAKADRTVEVDPGPSCCGKRWYLLGWSHTVGARRVLRVDGIAAVEPLLGSRRPPASTRCALRSTCPRAGATPSRSSSMPRSGRRRTGLRAASGCWRRPTATGR